MVTLGNDGVIGVSWGGKSKNNEVVNGAGDEDAKLG